MSVVKLFTIVLFFAGLLALGPQPASAKDEWRQVRSRNFFLVGNASENDIRKVATRLEQFREGFRLLFANTTLNASVPTNVVVFKNDSSFDPFKPKRADGKIDTSVAGYFQPGEDVNYITLAAGGTDSEMFGTIFHEYVHFILDAHFGRSEIPPWFNEGLAEFYQTFEIEKDQTLKVGLLQSNHVLLLREYRLIPLREFFNISNHSLLQEGRHSKSIFYAQAWALIHYLSVNGKGAGLKKFLALTMAKRPAEQAFQEAFGIGYTEMERLLRNYVEQASFRYMTFPLKAKLTFDTEMQSAPISEAESNAYLGDLLYHTNRADDAEPYLNAALVQRPDLSLANATLGMVKMRQQKFDEAKRHLEKAVAGDQRNHLAFYRYAYLLSREGRDELGYVSKFDSATSAKMRNLLKQAIAINPSFTESYELLAFINLVNVEELDEAVVYLRTALKHQPGNERYIMRLAEVYLRQNKFQDATDLAEKIVRSTEDPMLRTRAENLAKEIRQRQEFVERIDAIQKKYGETASVSGPSVGQPVLVQKRPGEEKPTLEEMAAATAIAVMRAINQSLRPLLADERRLIGKIIKIECKPGGIVYSVRAGADLIVLSSNDFRGLAITTYVPESGDAEVGCDANVSAFNAVITYRPGTKAPSRGGLVAIEFVPENFRFVDLDKEQKNPTFVVEEIGPPRTDPLSVAERRKAITAAIRDALRKPEQGERREIGTIERNECTSKGVIVHIRTATQLMKVVNSSPETMFMRSFSSDTANLQMGCGATPIQLPVVFVFKDNPDSKAATAGDLVSLEFVPKGFTLN